MLRNYFKSALANLRREKGTTAVNIAGLALGITCSLVLYLFISNANSFDRYHTNSNRIYRVVSQPMGNHGLQYTQAIPRALPDAFKEDFREVEAVAFTSYRRGSLVTVIHPGQVKKYEEPKGVAFSEPSFFKIFDRAILIGSSETGLDDPNEAIISKRWALKYFGKEDATGELLSVEETEYKITAVMEDFPAITDLPFDLILSYATVKNTAATSDWGNYADTDNCYVLLKKDEKISSVQRQMPRFVKKFTGNEVGKSTFVLQPLADLHSDSRFANYNTKLPKQAQTIFSVIAVFILITACVNFINMATAEAVKRTREVGIRKILGGGRTQLMFQFLLESLLVVAFAVMISFGGVQLFLSWLNPLMDLSLALSPSFQLVAFLGTLIVVVTLLSGAYPAWLMSTFRPSDALRNVSMTKSSGGFLLRRSLVVLQFFISQFFIIGTLVLAAQMDFMRNADIGFEKENIITVPIPKAGETSAAEKMKTVRQEVLRLPGVASASLAYSPPSHKAVVGTSVSISGKDNAFDTQVKSVDGEYLRLFDIRLLEGDDLKDADTISGVLVNEKFVEVAGLNPQSVVGRDLIIWGKSFPIEGVVSNFNTQSLSAPIEPVVLLNNSNDYRTLSIKINNSDPQQAVFAIQKTWESIYPEYIFQYAFLDDQIAALYRGETRITNMLKVFAGIAILIGCLGLLGLITFIANQRTKEIGVRKLLGASVEGIVLLFTSELAKLLIIGFMIAAPIAGYLMNLLLQEFAYKIQLGPMIFLTALGATFLISFTTIMYRAVRAAAANPVESLKVE
jgi:putative ABC transport system permease protein